MYKNRNPEHVSESILSSHLSVKKGENYLAETISLQDIFEKFDDISLIKMDIEGSEYDVMNSLVSIPESVRQLCIEFHHFCTDYEVGDTHQIIGLLKKFGFNKHYKNNVDSPHPLAELTFIRE